MNALVIYDSTFGNTKLIAEAIARELDARAVRVAEVSADDLEGIDLLVVGSPIIGWMPSEKMVAFLGTLRDGQLHGVKATTFDTRVKLFIHGDAKQKIAKALKQAGTEIITESQAFYVKGKEGPLFETELARAAEWAKVIRDKSGVDNPNHLG